MTEFVTQWCTSRTARWLCFAGLALIFISIPFNHLHNWIGYDEGVYIDLSRSVQRTGIPMRRDVPRDYLFITSPPLMYGLNGLVQRWAGDDIPTIRTIHIFLFTLPLIFGVFWLAWGYGGWLAGFSAWAMLLAHGKFLHEAHAVVLNIPLGAMSLLALFLFERCARTPKAPWMVALFLAMGCLVLTKFQGVTVLLAAGLFALDQAYLAKRSSFKNWVTPLALSVGGSAIFLAGLFTCYALWDPESVQEKFMGQVARAADEEGTLLGLVKRVRWTLLMTIHTVHASSLAILILAALTGLVKRPFARLLLWFLVATVLFNFVTMYLPGGGTYYLYAAFPALCVLVGLIIERAWNHPAHRPLAWFFLVMVGIRLVADSPPIHTPGHSEGKMSTTLQQTVLGITTPETALLTSSTALPALTDRRPALVQYFKDADLIRYIKGSPSQVDVAYLSKGDLFGIAERERGTEIQSLLDRHFKPVPGPWSGNLYRRVVPENPPPSPTQN